MKRNHSNTFHVDRLIERMWEIRDKLQKDENNQDLWQQWIFVRQVLSTAVSRIPSKRPGSR